MFGRSCGQPGLGSTLEGSFCPVQLEDRVAELGGGSRDCTLLELDHADVSPITSGFVQGATQTLDIPPNSGRARSFGGGVRAILVSVHVGMRVRLALILGWKCVGACICVDTRGGSLGRGTAGNTLALMIWILGMLFVNWILQRRES